MLYVFLSLLGSLKSQSTNTVYNAQQILVLAFGFNGVAHGFMNSWPAESERLDSTALAPARPVYLV